jgi:hypothetical protein
MSETNTSGKPTGGSKSPVDQRDLMCVVGLGLIGYGAFLIYPPAGFLAPGIILTGIAIFGVRG